MTQKFFTTVFVCSGLALMAAAPAHAQIPIWPGFYFSHGSIYPTQMVGEFPNLGHTTRIPVMLFPLKLTFDLGLATMDPMKPQQGHPDSPVSFVLKSPLFQAATFPNHPETDAAPTQYLDAYQRSNFWNIVSGSSNTNGGGSDFHILLDTPLIFPEALNVPVTGGYVDIDGDGNLIGRLDWAYFHSQLDSLLALASPGTIAVILLDNVSFYNYDNGGDTATAGGYHSHRGDQTFIAVGFGYDRNDTVQLGHELAEWLVDPYGTSLSPGWVKPKGTCSTHMEVGDPLHGQFFPIKVHPDGQTFHLEDLAFEAWFAHDQPSNAINGWQTFQGLALPNPGCN